MKAFRSPLRELGEFEEIRSKLKNHRGLMQIGGCIDSQRAHLIDALGEGYPLKIIVAANDLKAKEIAENYRFFDRNFYTFPAKDFIFFQADVHSNQLERGRIRTLQALCGREREKELCIITTMTALMNRMMPPDQWQKASFTLTAGEEISLPDVRMALAGLGYEAADQVDGMGQFSVRGGIVDIFPLTQEEPVRIELWGDEIDSIRRFDPDSQRSLERIDSVTIYPAGEIILSAAAQERGKNSILAQTKKQEALFRKKQKTEEAYRVRTLGQEAVDRMENGRDLSGLEVFLEDFYPEAGGLLDYLPEDALFFLDEPVRLMEAALSAEKEYRESMAARLEKGYIVGSQMKLFLPALQVQEQLLARRCVGLCTLESVRSSWQVKEQYSIQVHSVSPYNNSFETLEKDLQQWKKNGSRVILLSASRTRGKRLAQDLQRDELNAFYSEDTDRELAAGEIMVTCGSAHRGYEYPLIKFVVLTDSDIFGQEKKKPRRRTTQYEGRRISSFTDLAPGDYVVHESHGLGIYRGIEKITTDKVVKDYMKIEYQGGSNLYVPASSLDVIQKYAGAGASTPRLSRLGGSEWKKTKSRVRGAVREIARELVDLYAVRSRAKGVVYGPDTVWQREFEEMFPFEETEDQLQAIADTKRDMEQGRVMDRLICGDVGYGKTEIALRAAFKAVQEGMQVAYLVPTTILAQQHYNTFTQRLKDFPVRVDLLCRFRSPQQQKKTIADLKRGTVDIVIGTHRLLSKDVVFKSLGLLIIDEEQRFGVTHKEKIKQLKTNVDVLTLTATPIPRTLHMSLIGIRDMSVLEEPPSDRLPIQTFVMEYNDEMVREAICRELARNGQVYYVYNRVNTIAEHTARLAALIPEARIAFAHGQMRERDLEQIMYEFINGEIDVLVSTTIVETGLDIPNANTMIIHDADTMGLSQLYQLRGRIGRSGRNSYAFLMYRRDKMLREVAEKRLSAIREFTELGSGFRIAMRDLEIRGAGNLLGSEQHGHMDAVGYDLYVKLLNESVMALKGKQIITEDFETTIDLDIDAYIPPRYIENENRKLEIYKRIASIRTPAEYDEILEELIDRFGDPPVCALNLLRIALLRSKAHENYLTDVTAKEGELRFVYYPQAPVDVTQIAPFLEAYSGRMTFRADASPYFLYKRPKRAAGEDTDVLQLTGEVLDHMQMLLEERG